MSRTPPPRLELNAMDNEDDNDHDDDDDDDEDEDENDADDEDEREREKRRDRDRELTPADPEIQWRILQASQNNSAYDA